MVGYYLSEAFSFMALIYVNGWIPSHASKDADVLLFCPCLHDIVVL